MIHSRKHKKKVREEECHSTEKQCSSLISEATQQKTMPVLRTEPSHDSTNHPSFNSRQLLHPPGKRTRPSVNEGIDGSSALDSSHSNITSFSSTDKSNWLLSFTRSNYASFKSFYKYLNQDNVLLESLRRNGFPSIQNQALISFTYPLDLEFVKKENAKHFEPPLPKSGRKFNPTISERVIIQFLSFVHLNTVVGIPSQGFAYSQSEKNIIKYLGILPQEIINGDVSVINQDENEKSLLKLLSKQLPPTTRINKAMCCLIITHPTSNIFLTEMEIAQLYLHTRNNSKCFGIVISPRNTIPNMLCVKLTKEGFDKINEFEQQFLLSPKYSDCFLSCYLALLIKASDFNFYSQIPCAINDEPCISSDCRVYQDMIIKAMSNVVSQPEDFW